MVDIVTKGKICLGVLSFCFNADYLSINLTSDNFFNQIIWVASNKES